MQLLTQYASMTVQDAELDRTHAMGRLCDSSVAPCSVGMGHVASVLGSFQFAPAAASVATTLLKVWGTMGRGTRQESAGGLPALSINLRIGLLKQFFI